MSIITGAKALNLLLRFSCTGLLLCATTAASAAEWVDTSHREPEPLFAEKCGMCHRAQGMGTTLLQRRYDPELALPKLVS